CADCGTRLEGAKICPKCGLELPEETPTTVEEANAKKKSAPKSAPKSGNDSTWDSLEEIISVGGWLSLYLLIIAALVLILQVILNFIAGKTFLGILNTIGTVFTIYTIFTYGRIYSKKCKDKDWKFLMTDIFVIGKFRIPKMLAFGVLLAIFAQGWGGFLVYSTAFLIFFLSPEKGTHKWQ
ncbi:MAG: hypothetical protein ACTSRX_07895, partial [Promethearchaeota archaeon]